MNIEQQNKILWGIACVALFTAVVGCITVVYNETQVDADEFKFLKLFAYDYIDYDEPFLDCKKGIEMHSLAKLNFTQFESKMKQIADKKCGFDINTITT